ncbi:MAG TPA: hypothetical protein VNI20_13740 [Fimbriimonadaceae bacterium]|nr:hypothetical protein [Fimbriimonadaceae bacterium]
MPTIYHGVAGLDLGAWVVTDSLTGKKTAVAWNGMAYDPVSIGNPMDLKGSIKFSTATFQLPLISDSIEYSLAARPAGPVCAAMLHLTGHDDLAQVALGKILIPYGLQANVPDAASLIDELLVTATTLRIASGQDWNALLLARRARRFHSLAQDIKNGHGAAGAPWVRSSDSSVYDSMISDLNDRLALKRPPITEKSLTADDKDQRIALLVTHLPDYGDPRLVGDDVSQMIPNRLVAEGDEGIEALIDHLDDPTLTRALDGRSFSTTPRLMTVGDVAFFTMTSVLGLAEFGSPSKARTERVTRLWQETKGMSKPDRWLAVLEGETGQLGDWTEAAKYLSLPPWMHPLDGANGVSGDGARAEPLAGPQVALRSMGSEFAQKVTNALARRTDAWMRGDYKPFDASDVVLYMASWDPARAVPALRMLKKELISRIESKEGAVGMNMGKLAEVVSALAYAKADGAWEGYEKALNDSVDALDFTFGDPFAPLWQQPDDSTSAQITTRFFSAHLDRMASYCAHRGSRLSMLVYLPAFRQCLVEALKDKSVELIGTRSSESVVSFNIKNGMRNERVNSGSTAVPVGGELEMRVCDDVLSRLSRTLGMSKFDLALSTQFKDECVADAIAVVSGDSTRWIWHNPDTRPVVPGFRTPFPSRSVWVVPYRSL